MEAKWATLSEMKTHWSRQDVLDANDLLDAFQEAAADDAAQREAEMQTRRRR